MGQAVPNIGSMRGATVSEVRIEPAPVVPAAGWYPDPADPAASRWWNGEGWTDHVQPAAVAAVPVAPVTPIAAVAAPAVPSALDEHGVPFSLFADPAFDPAVLAPAQQPASQEDWHNQTGRGRAPKRQVAGSVSLSTSVPTAASRKHDPYRERNWIAGVAIVLAVLSIPALGARVVFDLPPLTQSIFAGGPIAIALLALAMSVRRGVGIVLSIVATLLAGAVLAAGLLIDPEILRDAVNAVVGLLPS
jgi:hypothetical protein